MITWTAFSSLILLRMAASVEDFPLPVGPVTSTIPLRISAASDSCLGRLSCVKSGTLVGITRITMAQVPRWVNMLTRKRDNLARL